MTPRLVMLSLLALSACTVGPDFHSPAAPRAQAYTREPMPSETVDPRGPGGGAQRFIRSDAAPRTWWRGFGSGELDRLVDEALHRSPTVEAARSRLIAARENYRAQAGQTELPSVDAGLSATRRKVDLASFGLANTASPPPFTLYDASVSVTYLLDVFGGNRRALEGTRAQVDYAAFELDAARLSLAGNVVSAAIRRASLRQQLALTRQLAAAQAQQLGIMERRQAAGGVSELDVHAQRTLLAQTRATIPPLAAQLAQTEHRLAVLVGLPSAEADMGDIALDELRVPGTVPVTLPSTLARERPDIRASEALLHRASADVGVATANLFPQFSIAASAGSERTHIRDILKQFNVWSIGLSMTQPIFRGGALRAQRRAAQATYQAALADYRETVLQALQQVADALQALQSDAETLDMRDAASREAEASLHVASARYAAGGISEFALIDAQRQALAAGLDRTKAQADRLADTAALYQSLGGSPLEQREAHDAPSLPAQN